MTLGQPLLNNAGWLIGEYNAAATRRDLLVTPAKRPESALGNIYDRRKAVSERTFARCHGARQTKIPGVALAEAVSGAIGTFSRFHIGAEGRARTYGGLIALGAWSSIGAVLVMQRVVDRSASQGVKAGPTRRSRPNSPLPLFVPPQLSQLVEKPPSGPQWVHEIKLDGFRMAARIDNGRVQLLTRTGLDWTAKYPRAAAALANVNVKTAYLDGELCGVDEAGLPSFAHTQAATDGERGVHVVYYAFDLLHIGGWDISSLTLLERKALLEPLVANKPGLQYNGHESGDGALILSDVLTYTDGVDRLRAVRPSRDL